MNKGRSNIAGIVAVVIWGIGLIYQGKIEMGLWLLGMAIVFSGAIYSQDPGGKFFWLALGAAACVLALAYHAASNELTGMATYYDSFGKHARGELVSRATSPEKFRKATNLIWGLSVFCGILSAVFWRQWRRAED